jgi:hypothetical protein
LKFDQKSEWHRGNDGCKERRIRENGVLRVDQVTCPGYRCRQYDRPWLERRIKLTNTNHEFNPKETPNDGDNEVHRWIKSILMNLIGGD